MKLSTGNHASIQLYDTLKGKKLSFQPINPGKVRIYCCGPTVYGFTHIGNARAALTLDLVSRIFQMSGYEVEVARNFTDVDDKIIDAAHREKEKPEAIAEKYRSAYEQELGILQTRTPDFSPKATEYISEMIQMIEGLIEKNHAYASPTKDGMDVYFSIESFQNYGELSRRKVDDMVAAVRIDPNESKRHPLDFALWKAAKPGEPFWESPWGRGRPGWHIECSAMIHKIFEHQTIDVHMGGMDLIFPHHENEKAQSESLTSHPLARYWIHNGMLEINKEKMSKSVGNIIRTNDFLEKYGPETLRLLMFQQHYHSPCAVSDEAIIRAEALVARLYTARKWAESANSHSSESLPQELKNLGTKIEEALRDDFNSAKALGYMLAAARVCFRENKPEYWTSWREALPFLREILGLLNEDPDSALEKIRERKLRRMGISRARSEEIEEKLKARDLLRSQKKFAESDAIREELEKEGILIMDGVDGATWTVAVQEKESGRS